MKYLLLFLLTACATTDKHTVMGLTCIESYLFYLSQAGINVSSKTVEAAAKSCNEGLKD